MKMKEKVIGQRASIQRFTKDLTSRQKKTMNRLHSLKHMREANDLKKVQHLVKHTLNEK